jgi:hypothetical protein
MVKTSLDPFVVGFGLEVAGFLVWQHTNFDKPLRVSQTQSAQGVFPPGDVTVKPICFDFKGLDK